MGIIQALQDYLFPGEREYVQKKREAEMAYMDALTEASRQKTRLDRPAPSDVMDTYYETFPAAAAREAENRFQALGKPTMSREPLPGSADFGTPEGATIPMVRTPLKSIRDVSTAMELAGKAATIQNMRDVTEERVGAKTELANAREFLKQIGPSVFDAQQWSLIGSQVDNMPKETVYRLLKVAEVRMGPEWGPLEEHNVGRTKIVGQRDPITKRFYPVTSEQEPQGTFYPLYNPDTKQTTFFNPLTGKEVATPEGFGKAGAGGPKPPVTWVIRDKETGKALDMIKMQPGEVPTAPQGAIALTFAEDHKLHGNRGLTIRTNPDGSTEVSFGGQQAEQPGEVRRTAAGTPAPMQEKRVLPAEQQKSLDDLMTIEKQIDNIEKKFGGAIANFTGPISGRINKAISKVVGHPTFEEFRSLNSQLFAVVYGLSGKQINQEERAWLKEDILPELQQPSENYYARMRAFKLWVKMKLETSIQNLGENFKVGTSARLKTGKKKAPLPQPGGKGKTGSSMDDYWE